MSNKKTVVPRKLESEIVDQLADSYKKEETDSVRDVISGIVPSSGSSPLPSFAINSCKIERRQCNMRTGKQW